MKDRSADAVSRNSDGSAQDLSSDRGASLSTWIATGITLAIVLWMASGIVLPGRGRAGYSGDGCTVSPLRSPSSNLRPRPSR